VTLSKRDGGPEIEVQRNQSVRFGPGGGDLVVPAVVPDKMRWQWWATGLLGILLLVSGLIVWTGDAPPPVAKTPALLLLNPDFLPSPDWKLPFPDGPMFWMIPRRMIPS
jgi:hypothetical protein